MIIQYKDWRGRGQQGDGIRPRRLQLQNIIAAMVSKVILHRLQHPFVLQPEEQRTDAGGGGMSTGLGGALASSLASLTAQRLP
jgi:hypothetical protein